MNPPQSFPVTLRYLGNCSLSSVLGESLDDSPPEPAASSPPTGAPKAPGLNPDPGGGRVGAGAPSRAETLTQEEGRG